MDPLLLAILITFAIRHAAENGKTEYAHIRDRRAAELARTYPDWSPSRIKRVARRAARGYWWHQIRHGFPEVRTAYTENKELAEAARVEAETAGLKRRSEIRERIRKALEEADQIREEQQRRWLDDDEKLPTTPWKTAQDQERPAGGQDATKAADGPETAPHGPGESKPVPPQADDRTDPQNGPEPIQPPEPDSCYECGRQPAVYRSWAGMFCDPCWLQRTGQEPGSTPHPDDPAAPASKDERGARVIPLKPPQAPASATPTPTEGDPMTVPTGEYTGYEAAVANWNAIAQLSQQLLTHYEQIMAAYKGMNTDDQTIGRAAACHEAEEQHLTAVQAALRDFVTRHGAVKETKEATGARGDEAVYTS